jgi:hypothetical protein
MEKAGTVTRVKGSRPGISDTWTLTGTAPDGAGPAADPEPGQDGQPGDGTGSLDGAGENALDGAAGTPGLGQQDGDAEDGTSSAPDAGTEQPGPHDAAAAAGREDAASGEQDGEAVPDSGNQQDPDGDDDPREEDGAPADDAGEPGAPDPALVTEIGERIEAIRAAADRVSLVLNAGEDLHTALAGLDEIYEQAAQARRSLKAAISGRKPRPPGPADSGRKSLPTWTPTRTTRSPRTRSTRCSATAPA